MSLNHLLVDHAAMLLSSAPTQLNGVILTENLFGDILSDQAGAIVGSQDVLASAGLANPTRQHVAGRPGIFEPVNLKTGALAGLGKVNPLGAIQSIVIMLDTAFGLVGEAESLESAIRKTLDPRELIGSDSRTADIGGVHQRQNLRIAFSIIWTSSLKPKTLPNLTPPHRACKS